LAEPTRDARRPPSRTDLIGGRVAGRVEGRVDGLVDRLVRRDLLLLRLEAARGRRTARVAGVVGRRLPVSSGRMR
jgi:hypothetical protein